ncbi:hypothetical protein CEXT_125401 [Caerostris extrusa]|uniref:Uncharacterized protein n=1 Tax=Caerostris extrusa TaxID=172846 RepID=A0AAV4MTC1_CAEEX|nr:hypothetical protein CEXT_125401 [Caerostris extrusa]
MAKYKARGYVAKKGPDIPVAPCQGWFDPCEFCDKDLANGWSKQRKHRHKIPAKPGIFMIGLKRKNSVEFVDMIMDENDFQTLAFDRTDHAREHSGQEVQSHQVRCYVSVDDFQDTRGQRCHTICVLTGAIMASYQNSSLRGQVWIF